MFNLGPICLLPQKGIPSSVSHRSRVIAQTFGLWGQGDVGGVAGGVGSEACQDLCGLAGGDPELCPGS